MGLLVRLKKKFEHFSLDVSWEMENELLVLFGPSGSGKSLTLQLMAGLMKPDEGRVVSNGHTFFDSTSGIDVLPRKRSLGYVVQDRVLFPHMTVRQNIEYGLVGARQAERKKRTDRMISTFHLESVTDKYPAQISGGQKQRVTLARALIGRPAALLLDEPFSALDNVLRIEMRRLLRNIHDNFSVPVVMVTHDLLEAYTLADTVVVYSQGRVARAGKPDDIFHNPSNPDIDLYLALNFPLLVRQMGSGLNS
jgi:molybdate transport system ATP-binding protein